MNKRHANNEKLQVTNNRLNIFDMATNLCP